MLWSSEQPPLPPRLSTWFVHAPLDLSKSGVFYSVSHFLQIQFCHLKNLRETFRRFLLTLSLIYKGFGIEIYTILVIKIGQLCQ